MKCPRCEGLMVSERLMDLQGGVLYVQAWRCINCGCLLDDTIQQHRRNLQLENEHPARVHQEAA